MKGMFGGGYRNTEEHGVVLEEGEEDNGPSRRRWGHPGKGKSLRFRIEVCAMIRDHLFQ
jgi:hypothetical protein